MEADSRMGQQHEQKAEKERLEKISIARLESKESFDDGFLVCQPTVVLNKEDKKKIVNSVQLTKALVLLGFSCWSQLEPGEFIKIYIYIYIYIIQGYCNL